MQTSALSEFWQYAWEASIEQATAGEPAQLISLLSDGRPENVPIPPFVRQWFADLIAGKISLKGKRGVKSRIKDKQAQIRIWFEALTSPTNTRGPNGGPWKKGAAIAELAKMHGVSEPTIRDALAERKTFAEKNR